MTNRFIIYWRSLERETRIKLLLLFFIMFSAGKMVRSAAGDNLTYYLIGAGLIFAAYLYAYLVIIRNDEKHKKEVRDGTIRKKKRS